VTRADWNHRVHRAILAAGMVPFGVFSVVYVQGAHGVDRSIHTFLVLVLAALYGVYALMTSIAIHRFENVRGGVLVCHAIFIVVIGLSLFGLRVVGLR